MSSSSRRAFLPTTALVASLVLLLSSCASAPDLVSLTLRATELAAQIEQARQDHRDGKLTAAQVAELLARLNAELAAVQAEIAKAREEKRQDG
jgi:septal ring factor EnvC (AmiA/AmiB activator)